MTPEEAILTVWPLGNPNINSERISSICIPKVLAKLAKFGATAACHGSYNHLAMEVIANRESLVVQHNIASDTVQLKRARE